MKLIKAHGAARKGKRGRVAGGKTAVFGLLKRNGKVYTVVAPNIQTATLLPIIREKVRPDSIVYTDCYRRYDVIDVSEFNYFLLASITVRTLLKSKIISTVLKTFETKLRGIYVNLMVFLETILSCI